MPRLIVLTGPDAGKEFLLTDGELTLGRHESCDFRLTDSQVSRKHCTVQRTDERLTVRDLASGNGTLVAGVKISQAVIGSGEKFRLGDSSLVFLAKGATPPGIVRTLPGDAGSVLLARPDHAGTEWLRARLTHLGVLYEASRATSEILDVDELLGRLLDLAMRTTEADSGGIFLDDGDGGDWLPTLERQGSDRPAALSRTIIDYVKRERVGVLATDAGLDDRFAGGESIARHDIREVIAVPMKGRHGTVGALVLQTLGAASKAIFTEDHLTLALALAHQGALAVEETRYYQAMLNAGKLAAVGQAMASLSHHIKNIMHGIRFGSELVRQGLTGDDRDLLGKGWSIVERNQSRIDALIQDMLSYSKDREPVRTPTNISKLIADVVEIAKAQCRDAVTFEVTLRGDSVVPCDGEAIHRALLNIVGNAVDAVGDRDSGRVTIRFERNEATARIAVGDNGPGVPDEDRDAIFEAFVSRKGSRGTGLGLPVSRKVLREHGGDVTLEGASTFVLSWPTH